MALTRDELETFHRFAEAKLVTAGAESLQELVDLWTIDHPSGEVHASNVAAVQAAIRDMDAGDSGRPAKQVVQDLRRDLT